MLFIFHDFQSKVADSWLIYQKGTQQDPQEFLGFLLNEVHGEILVSLMS